MSLSERGFAPEGVAAEVADALPSFGRSFSVKSADLAAAAGNFLWLASYELSRAGVAVIRPKRIYNFFLLHACFV